MISTIIEIVLYQQLNASAQTNEIFDLPIKLCYPIRYDNMIGDKLQTDSEIKDLEEIRTLFNTKVGHFADKSARWLFKKTEHLHGLVLILASELAEHLEFSEARIENRSIVDDTLRDLVGDMVFTVPFRDTTEASELTIYILIEHQSTVDQLMGYRVLSYMCQIWHEQLTEQKNAKVPVREWRLRPILPIVFYTGTQRWEIPISLTAVMDIPALMSSFVPTFETLFLGVKDEDIDNFTEVDHPFGWLMTVLKQENADETSMHEALTEALTHLESLASDNPELHNHALLYLYFLVFFRRPDAEQAQLRQLIQSQTQDKEVENIIMTGAEALIQQGFEQGEKRGEKRGLKQGIEQGIEQGEKRGEIQAKREFLLKLLNLRIGAVPDTVIQRISRIRSRSRLDFLLEQLATAEKIDDIEW
ncbi:hypothetical protein C6497_08840 [Candidatus Poribacteria bacterium]|nr:MAG: hypothetical protein C6497_08840 [Candidatus Poribacteria bacterium]